MRKNTIFLIMVFCMFTLLACFGVFAGGMSEVYVNSREIEVGNSVVVYINGNNFYDVCGGSLEIGYDSNNLSVEEFVQGDLLAVSSVVKNAFFSDNSVKITWAGISAPQSGSCVAAITFKCDENADFDETEIKILNLKIFDIDGKKINCSTQNGFVTLVKNAPDNGLENPEDNENIQDSDGNEDSESNNGSDSSGDTDDNEDSGDTSQSEKQNNSLNVVIFEDKKPLQEGEETQNSGNQQQTTETNDTAQENSSENNDDTAQMPSWVKYEDVDSGKWYFDAVSYVSSNNLMNGMGEGLFAPDFNLTRAMLVTIIYRMEGQPEFVGELLFDDVEADLWYTSPICWANANKIVNGMAQGIFAPNEDITREQLAVMLYNYAQYSNNLNQNKGDLSAFSDRQEISPWAEAAMEWANGNRLINGRNEGVLAPKDKATRAEAATLLMRFAENICKNSS